MPIAGKDTAEPETWEVEALLEEARLLFPSFISHGQIMPDKDLARLKSYKRFLRLGILLWLAKGQDGFREILANAFVCDGCGQDAARSHLGYLWKGIETGCVMPSALQSSGSRSRA